MTLCSKNRYRKAPRQVTDVMQTSMLRFDGSCRIGACLLSRKGRARTFRRRNPRVRWSVLRSTADRAGSRKTRPEWFAVRRSLFSGH